MSRKVPLKDYIDYLELELEYHRNIESSKDVIKQFLTKLVKAKKVYNDDPNGVVTEKLVKKKQLKKLADKIYTKALKITKFLGDKAVASGDMDSEGRKFALELATGVHDEALLDLAAHAPDLSELDELEERLERLKSGLGDTWASTVGYNSGEDAAQFQRPPGVPHAFARRDANQDYARAAAVGEASRMLHFDFPANESRKLDLGEKGKKMRKEGVMTRDESIAARKTMEAELDDIRDLISQLEAEVEEEKKKVAGDPRAVPHGGRKRGRTRRKRRRTRRKRRRTRRKRRRTRK